MFRSSPAVLYLNRKENWMKWREKEAVEEKLKLNLFSIFLQCIMYLQCICKPYILFLTEETWNTGLPHAEMIRIYSPGWQLIWGMENKYVNKKKKEEGEKKVEKKKEGKKKKKKKKA